MPRAARESAAHVWHCVRAPPVRVACDGEGTAPDTGNPQGAGGVKGAPRSPLSSSVVAMAVPAVGRAEALGAKPVVAGWGQQDPPILLPLKHKEWARGSRAAPPNLAAPQWVESSPKSAPCWPGGRPSTWVPVSLWES